MRLGMVKVVALSEYNRRMRQRGFVLSSFLLPLVVIVAIVIAGFLGTAAESVTKPLGVVDLAGVLGQVQPLPPIWQSEAIGSRPALWLWSGKRLSLRR